MTLEFLREVQARLIARDRFNLRDMRVRSGPQLIYEFQQTLGKWRELIAHRNAQGSATASFAVKVLTGQMRTCGKVVGSLKRFAFLGSACYFLFMHGSSGAVRKTEIESRLQRGVPVNATALAKEFLVSEDAIRRDLRALAAEGKCKRVYGGGLPISPDGVPLEHRLLNDSKEKRALALAALPLVSEASTVFLDSGSTNLALAREMPPDRSLTIATNSISIASALLERKNFKVIVLGGEIERETGAAIGLSAFREAERLNFDLCFLGACAVSVSLGIGAFQMADAEFKRTLIARSDRTAALVTMDKVETRAPFQVAALAVLNHVVLEAGTSEEIVSTFSNAGPKVIIGKP